MGLHPYDIFKKAKAVKKPQWFPVGWGLGDGKQGTFKAVILF